MENLKEYMKLTIPEEFGEVENGYYNVVIDNVAENANNIKRCDYRLGASKLCLIPEENKYVIKIPFNGCFYLDIDNNETFSRFYCAKTENEYDNWNYCLSELEIYNKAKDAGFEMFLAETDYLGASKTGHPIYVQEKVLPYAEFYTKDKNTSSDNSKEISKRIHNIYRNFCYNYHLINNENMLADEAIGYVFCETGEAFLAMIIETYTYELVEKFSRWVIDEAREIAMDLHCRNIGFRASDGTPCLLDFSGFYD